MYAKNKSTNTEERGSDGNSGKSHRVVVEFQDNKLAAMVFGQHDQNLARIEQRLHVSLINRGNRIAIEGAAGPSAQAKSILTELYEMAEKGRELTVGDVDGVVRMLVDLKTAGDSAAGTRAAGNLKIVTRNKVVLPRSSGQADYIEKLQKNEMVFGVGPAGTGKTYLAVAMAVSCMISGEVDRIILSRPAVEAGEKLGFLPG
ncbi:MAG: PhoH family protein, partial [Kordiimonadaceae bacterium]|nr:PhoH family protein [Kordiimonadaceae bacterium]